MAANFTLWKRTDGPLLKEKARDLANELNIEYF